MDQIEHCNVDMLRQILDAPSGETECVGFIKTTPRLLYWTLCAQSGHDRYVIFDFPLGNKYRADALVLNSYSGAREAFFVEFEPPGDKIFTKAGVPSARMSGAQGQVDDWRLYIDDNRDQVRADMVRYAKRKDRLMYSARGESPCNNSGDELSDRNTFVHWKYVIVIGRSSMLSAENRQLVGRYRHGHSVDIITYDRLLRMAERRYEGKHQDTDAFVLNMPA